MRLGGWKTATITEPNKYSDEVDLGGSFKYVVVLCPNVVSFQMEIYVATAKGETYYPMYSLDNNATGDFIHRTATHVVTNRYSNIFYIGGVQWIKLRVSSTQVTKTLSVLGFN